MMLTVSTSLEGAPVTQHDVSVYIILLHYIICYTCTYYSQYIKGRFLHIISRILETVIPALITVSTSRGDY